MKYPHTLFVTAFISAAMSFGGVANAQMNMDHGKTGMAATPGMTDGEVRKIDKESGKLTIKHGEIKHMDMPGMTMVFAVKDKALLDKVQVGQKIKFVVVMEGSKMVVTDIQSEK